MASTFVQIDPHDIDKTGVFHNTPPVPVWLQFVPGIVKHVVVNETSTGYRTPNDINAILALPHINENVTTLDIGNKKYYPLFRGMSDIPVRGDQVLLCTFGGVNYYMGPLNTQNSPNKNTDHLYSLDISTPDNVDLYNRLGITDRDYVGFSKNFKEIHYRRLSKPDNPALDKPNDESKFDNHGDIMIEGRHGNSLRIGSRNINPYIFISNGRNPNNEVESLGDGSLISITDYGTINDHFKQYVDPDKKETVIGFELASDVRNGDEAVGAKRVTEMIKDVNGDADPNEIFTNYGFETSKGQILINSDRVTINSKKESMFLSAFEHVHIGAGRSLTMSINDKVVIDSNRVNMGKDATNPMVLGNKLKEQLDELIDAVLNIKIYKSQVVPQPLSQETANVASAKKLDKIKGNLTKILSGKHYVE